MYNNKLTQGAGGIGKAVAEWIIVGQPTQDLIPFHVQRFLDVHSGKRYLLQRTKEVVGRFIKLSNAKKNLTSH